MSFMNKLERKFGKYAVPNLVNYLLAGYAIGYLLQLFSPNVYSLLYLDPQSVMHGQIWRLFTWVLTSPQEFGIFLIFMFMFYYWIGHTLENYWGTFRYNLYMISGYLIMTIGSMLIYWISSLVSGGEFAMSLSMSTYYINLASFLAFATLFPDVQVYFMMVIPIKIKWLAIVDGVYLGYSALSYIAQFIQYENANVAAYGITQLEWANYCFANTFSIIFSVANFIVFFFATRNMKKYSPRELKRKHTYKKQVQASQNIAKHKCAICGRTSESNPELTFRFCSKCEGNYEYCQDHIFTHEHITK